jgi:glycosyltransferase involved in cell wall biosynthesis
MKILLLNQFFHPDLSATAQLATDLAEDLAAAGFEVTALATRGAYLGGGRLAASETYRGVRIERVRCTSLGKASVGRRLLDYGSFFGAAAARVLAGPRHDVVVAMSTPPLVATIGALRRRGPRALALRESLGLRPRPVGGQSPPPPWTQGERRRGTRFVYWLQDVYPELAVEFGVFGARSPAARLFGAASGWTLRRADAVVVLGEAMGERVRARGVAAERVHVLPNWADGAAVRPVPAEANEFLRAHGLHGKRVLLYSGNMGRAHDLSTIFGAARLLRGRPDIAFVFVGDGARRREVEAAARELPSIRLLPYQPRERLGASLSSGEVHLVTQEPFTVGLVEPSKLYGAMAAGRPVLYIGPPETEAARTVAREGIGAVLPIGDVEGVAAAIRELLDRSAELGARARAAFEARYDRPLRTAQFASILRALS